MFATAVRSSKDLAAAFEYDGETGYFYLYDDSGARGPKVVGAIRILLTAPDFGQDSVLVCWDKEERYVGLLIRGVLWAAFDAEKRKMFGGNYESGTEPNIPPNVRQKFAVYLS